MGISDDIRPKTYRPISRTVVKTEIKVAAKKIDDRDNGQLFQTKHDGDFFADTPIGVDKEKSKKLSKPKKSLLAKKHRWMFTVMIVLAIGVLIGLVAWQNYSTLKSYIDGSYKSSNDKSLTDIINNANDSINNYNNNGQSATGSTTTPTTQPAATSTATVDKSTIIISVLNGSGTKGSATAVANTLKTTGFTVSNISNAKSFNYAKTYIYYKTDDASAANLVADALSARTTSVVKNTSIIGSNYDIVVVVGKQ